MTKAKKESTYKNAENILELERIMRKVLRKAFGDATLDYSVQISTTSMEPGKVKYGFMINGLKKEIQPIALSFDTFAECKAVLSGISEEYDPVKMEELFHQGRINVYKNAIKSHEDRMAEMKDNPEKALEDATIPMEEVNING